MLRRLSGRHVLVLATITFSAIPLLLLILDPCTGGKIKASKSSDELHGRWNKDGLFPLYCLAGMCYGMIELVKRVMSRDIVGANVDKLRQVDSLVGRTLFHSAVRENVNIGMVGAHFL